MRCSCSRSWGREDQNWLSFSFGLGGGIRTGFFEADEREEGSSHLFDDIVKSLCGRVAILAEDLVLREVHDPVQQVKYP
jgi:hypothetical protein